MASLQGLGWPEDTGLRVPIQAPAGDPVAGLGAAVCTPARDGLFGPAVDMRGSAGRARAPESADGAPASVRRSGRVGWPLAVDVSRESIADHDACSVCGEQPV